MAAINFPAASESPWYNDKNGITYEYIGGTWRAVNALSNSFDDEYVEVTGDNMTGNLTLGTDKITLNATDGSATFAGDLSAAAGTFSGDVTSNVFYRTQPSGDPFGNILVSRLDTQDRLRIKADGEIAIGTTNIGNTSGINFLVTPDGTTKIGGSVVTSPNTTLNADGTASFKPTGDGVNIDSSGRLLVGTSNSNADEHKLQIEGNANSTASNGGIALRRGQTNPTSNEWLGQISFTDAAGSKGAYINGEVDGSDWAANDYPTRLVFSTTEAGASSPTERMRLRSDGNIGISNTPGFYPNTDNAASLGFTGFRWAALYVASGIIQTSDQRDKTEIIDASLGADFIKALRPVSYKWIEGGKRDTGEQDDDGNFIYKPVPGARTHWGFIAQEVKQAVDAAGVDFGGWVLTDKDDPNSQQALRYDQFIAPLTKALQEALAEIDVLKAKVATLESA